MTGHPRPAAERPGLPAPAPVYEKPPVGPVPEWLLREREQLERLADLVAERVQLVAVSAVPAELGAFVIPGYRHFLQLPTVHPAHEARVVFQTDAAGIDIEFVVNGGHRVAAFRFPYRAVAAVAAGP